MVPGKLVGALQRHKEDTNSVAAWLASTAKHYGYKSQAAGPNDKDAQQEASGRLKGKALKEAKSQPTGTKNGTGQKYIVALNDYVPIAEDIAKHRKPTIPVPMPFVSTINRVIDRGSSFRARMVEQGTDVDEKANKNHLYFVHLLEDSATYQAEEQNSLDDALVIWHFLMVDAEMAGMQILSSAEHDVPKSKGKNLGFF
ncbi:hypothetical protein FOXG_03757 [Fusarium oxysporum f. sp. lycopersici 4287]|uniref:DUF6604 domain-containing protein n=1 Tax=Fusarium oxysporum f. sp. lycopersici (strain 4287 / CBS 123668 / FGSC 9935 / NRRL 34936) TaxID=426428 RepID=A0A0J9UMG1_FUSO4|nr:hypothetical protein FOXG_03757 [Fusarium oxysporum f. sp. lycopersici 4287]KNB00098.1 hypothetical protein FOXG_03757 [Fusarium oxysporum f. sp. lycopersici 4287]